MTCQGGPDRRCHEETATSFEMNQERKRTIWSDADTARSGRKVPEPLLRPAELLLAE